MSEHQANDSAKHPEDARLSELLAAHTVPEPSSGFVEETLLRVGLHAKSPPSASDDYVDRVMAALRSDPIVGGRMRNYDGLSEHAAAVGPEPVQLTPRWPKVLAGLIAAAAVVFALVPRGPSPEEGDLGVGLGRVAARALPALDRGSEGASRLIRFSFPPAPGLSAEVGASGDPWASIR